MNSSLRSYLDVTVPHFHVCRSDGPDDGPHFVQEEAWEVRETVLCSVIRHIEVCSS